jgi:uncharacterized membrane protein
MTTLNKTATLPLSTTQTTRIESIDLLRGIVMIVMALDHVRDYFHADAFLFNPVDLSQSNVPLFFTRWITHFCAPVFVFLAGTSAYFVGQRRGTRELSSFLFKRGVWLLFLELTIINFSWFFNIRFSFIAVTVISALGMGMIILAAVVYLRWQVVLTIGMALVVLHNLLDPLQVSEGPLKIVYAFLFRPYAFHAGHFFVFIGYPFLPWAGVMMLGYCFGKLYNADVAPSVRKKVLLQMGGAMVAMFFIIRLVNVYGDPAPWTTLQNSTFTLLSFLNVTKYPPSLLYVLITLGPAFLFLAISESMKEGLYRYVIRLGRVPMFYYIVHLYVIHILAVMAALATGYHLSDMVFNVWVTDSPALKGYGFSLGVVYLVWIAVVMLLFPLCLWYEAYKTKHKEKWWLSYL